MEENNVTPTPKQHLSTPMAIVVAGFLIMVGILVSKTNIGISSVSNLQSKTLSEQVGVSKDDLNACIQTIDLDKIGTDIQSSIGKAMKHIPQNERGTPYSIIVGSNGVRTEILGADSYENVQKIITSVIDGNVEKAYKGDVTLSEPTDQVLGSINAQVTIIEYSDFECPFCKRFHPILKRIVEESNGTVRWIYRDYPLHQHSFEKLIAARCVAKLGGTDAYWRYGDLLFGMLKTEQDSISEQL
jgi:thiol-disulfide isomerase/thioredoxin